MSEFSIQSLTGDVNSHSTAWKILSMLKNHPQLKVVSKHATHLRRVVFDRGVLLFVFLLFLSAVSVSAITVDKSLCVFQGTPEQSCGGGLLYVGIEHDEPYDGMESVSFAQFNTETLNLNDGATLKVSVPNRSNTDGPEDTSTTDIIVYSLLSDFSRATTDWDDRPGYRDSTDVYLLTKQKPAYVYIPTSMLSASQNLRYGIAIEATGANNDRKEISLELMAGRPLISSGQGSSSAIDGAGNGGGGTSGQGGNSCVRAGGSGEGIGPTGCYRKTTPPCESLNREYIQYNKEGINNKEEIIKLDTWCTEKGPGVSAVCCGGCLDGFTEDNGECVAGGVLPTDGYNTYTFERTTTSDLSEFGIDSNTPVVEISSPTRNVISELDSKKIWLNFDGAIYYEDNKDNKIKYWISFPSDNNIVPEINPDLSLAINFVTDGVAFHFSARNIDDNFIPLFYRTGLEFINFYYGDVINVIGRDDDFRTRYGVIVRRPKQHAASDRIVLDIPRGQVEAKSCTDSDGEENYQVKGKVDFIDEYGPKEIWDQCNEVYGPKFADLAENYCDEAGIPMVFGYRCQNGCENGACVEEIPERVMQPNKCSSCGDGVLNPCNKDECHSLGLCTFYDRALANKCEPATVYIARRDDATAGATKLADTIAKFIGGNAGVESTEGNSGTGAAGNVVFDTDSRCRRDYVDCVNNPRRRGIDAEADSYQAYQYCVLNVMNTPLCKETLDQWADQPDDPFTAVTGNMVKLTGRVTVPGCYFNLYPETCGDVCPGNGLNDNDVEVMALIVDQNVPEEQRISENEINFQAADINGDGNLDWEDFEFYKPILMSQEINLEGHCPGFRPAPSKQTDVRTMLISELTLDALQNNLVILVKSENEVMVVVNDQTPPSASDVIEFIRELDARVMIVPYSGLTFGDILSSEGYAIQEVNFPDSCTTGYKGDLDDNGILDGIDIALFVKVLKGENYPQSCCVDLNEDGKTNVFDLTTLTKLVQDKKLERCQWPADFDSGSVEEGDQASGLTVSDIVLNPEGPYTTGTGSSPRRFTASVVVGGFGRVAQNPDLTIESRIYKTTSANIREYVTSGQNMRDINRLGAENEKINIVTDYTLGIGLEPGRAYVVEIIVVDNTNQNSITKTRNIVIR